MSLRQRRGSTTEVIKNAVVNLEKRVENAFTVLWDDLPSWQRDNHYIHSGYRPASASFKKSFASLGYLHNESVNIYSHLLGAVVFSAAGVVIYTAIKPRYETAALPDILAFACFFLGAALCLGMSGTYHTISNHSPVVAKFGNKLDYVGIVFLITGSFIPSIFYGFYCHPHLQEFYWTMVRIPLEILKSYGLMLSRFALLVLDAPQCLYLSASGPQHGDHTGLGCSFLWACPQCFLYSTGWSYMASMRCETGLDLLGWSCKDSSIFWEPASML